MIDKIKQHIEEAKAFNDKNKESLEQFRIKYLGSKGLLKELFTEFKNIPNDQKKDFGQVINTLKAVAEEKVKSIQEELESKEEIITEIEIDNTKINILNIKYLKEQKIFAKIYNQDKLAPVDNDLEFYFNIKWGDG